MSAESHPRVLDQRWRVWASVAIGGAVLFGALVGFVILPVLQGRQAGVDAWTAFCRAIGVAPGSPAMPQPSMTAPAQPVSQVAWTPDIINGLHSADRAAGQKIAAEVCVACHGETGISANPQWPHLSGQSAFAIYKQLHDYKSGARVNEQMTPVVQDLTERQMVDVAGYYANLARGTLDPQTTWVTYENIRRLVEEGDPARGIAACASCHGARAGGPIETPTLTGQRREYLVAQLQAYASGQRSNDVYRRMRGLSAQLKPEEIEGLAAYYAAARGLEPQAARSSGER